MKKSRKALPLSFVFAVFLAFLSCSKDKINQPRNVEFKVMALSNASIISVVHTNAEGDLTTIVNLSSDGWSKKVTIPVGAKTLFIGANATPVDETALLKVQILVNDVVVQEGVASGHDLTATAIYTIND